ncbi:MULTISPECIES: flavodoxin family protein [unclassified Fusibacter]|uniref:flavodoxin family protein n=1 Tax=unclassified Fusibacter TaxID=2624464 RepID=UPI001013526E|nr:MULTISPECIES: NAD(P)H-dependent oxidoreductase [unclassified Fusibacter]MCK8058369.1 NAD(P)H-dependent oxidoreductase [Fusibacter sp. A2]NPE20952.1 NAD(P)H-dependent oxidoreductase [Fusibacter sp. A1]RXV63154.1 NADPH-dependent oxidoreductase [Fusibacter sp. A1]
MSKIVVVSGSPRKKGNTISMVKIVEENIKKMDASVEFEYIYLIEKNLGYCLGCNSCLLKGPEKCLKRDDAKEILETMHSADGLIFLSPGYAHSVSGLFKNFIDRFMFLDHLPEFEGVPAMILSTAGGDGVGAAPKYMADMAVRWWGCNIIAQIGIGHAFYSMNEKYKAKYNKKLIRASEDLLAEMTAKQPMRPTFKSYMFFIFNKSEGQISPSAQPARHQYWVDKGWYDADYYYDTKITPLYKMVGGLSSALMKTVFLLLLGKDADKKLGAWTHNMY